ncbi:MAG: M36 family metallopeptidase [Nocardioidaceae bacterium]
MSSTRRRGAVTALAVTAVAGLTLSGVPNGVAAPGGGAGSGSAGSNASPLINGAKDRMGFYDAGAGSQRTRLQAATSIVSKRGSAFDAFAKSLGPQSIMDFDPATGTPRNLGRLDGFLTGPSSASASSVALNYVRTHLADLGLTSADLSTFKLREDYVDIAGIHHISWTQSYKGIPVFANGLKANVTKSGQLISLQGSPISGLANLGSHVSTSPKVSAASARAASASDVGGVVANAAVVPAKTAGLTKWSNQDQAQLVWFKTPTGLQLGWSTYVQAGGDALNYQHVIDAATGRVLFRRDTTNFDHGDALVYNNYPGAAVGGTQHVVNLFTSGQLRRNETWLNGKYTVAWADTNDDNMVNPGERTPVPGTATGAQFKLVPFMANKLCSPQFVCTWKPDRANSWRTNMNADVTQGFYYDNMYHNYLAQAPIGFTPQAGNFETWGGDPVLLNDLDGANTANGLPDAGHIDNANMSTPPDGISPTMQMYLFHFPGTSTQVEPYIATSSTMDPSVIFHEYTHGLSNRLVVDATGNSTLNSIQAGAMGEAWSDYYAMDNLVTRGYEKDTPASGEVFEGHYLLANKAPFRTEAIDCSVGATAPGCTGTIPGDPGGYTYGDFPIIGGAPEVHSSGEVWAQTMWDLRKVLGHNVADMVITRGMSLSANDPSMLDMRNAIVQADLAVYGGHHRAIIWNAFRNRGMGWYAGTIDSGDAYPKEDFHMPPTASTPRSTVIGQVTDPGSNAPVPNALVRITGHDSGSTSDYTAVTNANGVYQIPYVFIGRYAEIVVSAPGYAPVVRSIKVVPVQTVKNFQIRRDYAAASGGATIAGFNGPDYSGFGCGPVGAIDLSQGTGWGSTTGDNNGTPTNKMIPKYIVIKLPGATTVKGLAINPSATCGDPGSSSTAGYKVEASTNGTTWTKIAGGTFTSADRKLTTVKVAASVPGVKFVKYTILSPQVPDFHNTCPAGNYGGCSYTDTTEVEVYGSQR